MDTIEPTRFETPEPITVAGLSRHYAMDAKDAIPAQWHEFMPQKNAVLAWEFSATYGVSYNAGDSGDFDYLCGVKLEVVTPLPDRWSTIGIPARQYAVFGGWGDLSRIGQAYNAIFGVWLPGSAYRLAPDPCFEFYGDNFDSATLLGAEIWIPVDAR